MEKSTARTAWVCNQDAYFFLTPYQNMKPLSPDKIHVNSKEFPVTADPPAKDYRVDTHNLFDHDHLEGAWTFFRSDESVQPPHS